METVQQYGISLKKVLIATIEQNGSEFILVQYRNLVLRFSYSGRTGDAGLA